MKAFPIMTMTLTSLPDNDEDKEKTLCSPLTLTLTLFPLFLYFPPHSVTACGCVCGIFLGIYIYICIYVGIYIYLLASVLVLLSGASFRHTHTTLGPLVGDTNRRKERQKSECL